MSDVAYPVGDPVTTARLQAQRTANDMAVSLGYAIAGVGTTAMGSLIMMQAGMQVPLVLTPIARSPYR